MYRLRASAGPLLATLVVALAGIGWCSAPLTLLASAVRTAPAALSGGGASGAPSPVMVRPWKRTAAPSAGPAAAPIRLTASDGTGLTLVALAANGVLEPPLAFTELHLTFENPRATRIEGRFHIVLPDGAALSRFAMLGDAGWQEGEVVERRRAQVAYEDFLHRRQDPALLEQEAGNEFSARVFPIPASGRKELIVSYSQPLPRADQPYVIPLLGLAEIGQLDLRVMLGERPAAAIPASNLGGAMSERRMIELHRRDWTPDRDFEVGQERFAGRDGLRHANLAVVRVAAPVPAVRQPVDGLYVLIDSSASRALGYRQQVQRLAELVSGLRDAGTRRLGVAAFDQEVAPIYEGPIGGFGPAEVRRLLERRPLGATDLHAAIAWLADRLARSGHGMSRVLLLTDGVATAGDTETHTLKEAVRALGRAGIDRLDVLAVGGLRDDVVLRELVTGNLAHDGARIDGGTTDTEILARLTLACRSGIQVAVPGAAWIWPETLDGMQPGDEALVYADLPRELPFRLAVAGREVPVEGRLAPAERPLLERAWAQARIERLLHLRDVAVAGDGDLRQALGKEIVELSVKHRVVSPLTAMLVLETDADYARFGLDRMARADILTVGPGGLEVLARGPSSPRMATLPEDEARSGRRQQESKALATPGRGESYGTSSAMDAIPATAESPLLAERESGAASEEGQVALPTGAPIQAPAPPPTSLAAPRVPAPPAATTAEPRERVLASVTAGSDSAGDGAASTAESWPSPYTGRFAEVMAHLAGGRVGAARGLAEAWASEDPGDVLALVALGEVWEAAGEKAAAARAYGSLIDLYPSRADLRRLAGERLERLGDPGIALAIDTYAKAAEQRPDHPSGHRLLAWSLWRAGRFAAAFAALETGIEQRYPMERFPGVDRILKEDLGLLGAAWLHAEPARRAEVMARLAAHGSRLATEPSLRFVLSWETDANDVDLHVYDNLGGHAYYEHPQLPTGGELFADVTTGYGPECFAVSLPRGAGAAGAPTIRPARNVKVAKGTGATVEPAGPWNAAPYRLAVHYYSRGPMGYGMGTVQVVAFDGAGRLTLDPRPFVVMTDQAMLDLGKVDAVTAAREATIPGEPGR